MSKIRTKELSQAIYSSAKDLSGKELDLFLENTARFILKNRLTKNSEKILEELGRLLDEDGGIVRAKCISKNELSKKARDHITHFLKDRFDAKHVLLEEVIDKDEIGGVRIEVGDEVIDMTISTGLERLKEHLLSN